MKFTLDDFEKHISNNKKKDPKWIKEQKPRLIKQQLLKDTLEDYIENGLNMQLELLVASLYLRISSIFPIKSIPSDEGYYQYHALDNWPPDIKKMWRTINQIFDNEEKLPEIKHRMIINLIKNRWLSLNGIHFIKRA